MLNALWLDKVKSHNLVTNREKTPHSIYDVATGVQAVVRLIDLAKKFLMKFIPAPTFFTDDAMFSSNIKLHSTATSVIYPICLSIGLQAEAQKKISEVVIRYLRILNRRLSAAGIPLSLTSSNNGLNTLILTEDLFKYAPGFKTKNTTEFSSLGCGHFIEVQTILVNVVSPNASQAVKLYKLLFYIPAIFKVVLTVNRLGVAVRNKQRAVLNEIGESGLYERIT
jgi:hypothetical protein